MPLASFTKQKIPLNIRERDFLYSKGGFVIRPDEKKHKSIFTIFNFDKTEWVLQSIYLIL